MISHSGRASWPCVRGMGGGIGPRVTFVVRRVPLRRSSKCVLAPAGFPERSAGHVTVM